ncbi:MAG: 16S rRNA processing protein RimM [Clostridiales bacterium]|nr:16S rRNA processing protein RimM [Clostridiales bacterium]
MVKYFTVGQILKPQGIKGELKVRPLTEDMSRFEDLSTVFFEDGHGYRCYIVENIRYMGDNVILKIEACNDRSTAEEFRNQYVWIPRHMAVPLPKDSYYIADIIGSMVHTQQDRELGSIVDIIRTGSNDVYVVEGRYGEILIPAIKDVIKDIDIDNKSISIDTTQIEGLIPNEF